MNKKISILIILSILFITNLIVCQVPEGTISPSTNIRSYDYPYILSDLSVIFKVKAPDADNVQIDLGKLYDMKKDAEGFWTVTTEPIEPGFHYYSLVIDGIKVCDPASETFYGMGRMASGIDIPEKGVDFYDIKDVPHGTIRSEIYYSKTTESWRKLNVYTPPNYDKDTDKSYPVLYIQHGGGEDERGWVTQGKTNLILDNLIAEGKAVPMIVVIANGNVSKPGKRVFGYTSEAMDAFKEEMLENVIPFVEGNFRVRPGVENRALSGLSMGGGQTFFTGLSSMDKFSSIGVFSSGIFGGIGNLPPGALNPKKFIDDVIETPEDFNSKMKVFYISVGEQDPRIDATKKFVEELKEKNINVLYTSFPGGHEWQPWRKSLHDFSQKLFK